MIKEVEFTKMHGAGNDYIYINTELYPLADPGNLAIEWSKPHTGIGADGLVLISSSQQADFKMRIFNADGSEAMMCGNASRCIGKYVYEKKLTQKEFIRLETLSGIKELQLKVSGDEVTEVTVDMGIPEIGEEVCKEIRAGHEIYEGTIVSMGNPHLVIFTDDVEKIDLSIVGPLLENHALFPNRTNVEFAQIISPEEIRMSVWERGSGITQACGTGACATAVAGALTGRSFRSVKVVMDGGPLAIDWNAETGKVYMRGDAVTVFEGSIRIGE